MHTDCQNGGLRLGLPIVKEPSYMEEKPGVYSKEEGKESSFYIKLPITCREAGGTSGKKGENQRQQDIAYRG